VRCAGAVRAAAVWALAFAVFTVVTQWAFGSAGQWQFERSAFEGGAWWQLATSQWVHLTWPHATMNIAAMALIVVALAGWVDRPTQGMALLGGYAGVALVVALDPACAYYAGVSGALHGLLAGSAVRMVFPQSAWLHATAARWTSTRRVLGCTVLAGMVVKLLIQHVAGASSGPGWLGVVAYAPAHWGGAVAGALVVFVRVMLGPRLQLRAQQGALTQRQRHKG